MSFLESQQVEFSSWIDQIGNPVKMLSMTKALQLLVTFGVMTFGVTTLASAFPVREPAQDTTTKPAEKSATPGPKASAKKAAAAKAVLPERLLAAKTMCINPMQSSAADAGEARTELKAWGRFTLVDDCAQADIALWINARFLPANEVCHTVAQIFANSNKAILWSQAASCTKSTKGTVKALVQHLRKEMTPAAAKKAKSATKP